MEFNQISKKKTMKKSEDSLRNLRYTIIWVNTHIIEVPEGEQRNKGEKSLFKEMIEENFTKLGKATHVQIQEDQKYQISRI